MNKLSASNPMGDIMSKLKKEQIRETVLMKKPTHTDLKTALDKHKDKLGNFYQNRNIKKVTEDQLVNGDESMSLQEPEMSPEQAKVLSNSVHNVPDFKNKMAKRVLKAITSTPPRNDQIPSLLVAASFGGDFEDNDGSPNANKGVKDLRRKFEDNEADIISELYARHFKNQNDVTATKSKTDRDSVTKNLLAPDDSIEEMGFNTDIDDEVIDESLPKRANLAKRRGSQSASGAPRPETYSKPL